MNKYIRKIIKNGAGTYYVSIPKEIMKELKLRERQKVVIRKSRQSIVINDWEK